MTPIGRRNFLTTLGAAAGARLAGYADPKATPVPPSVKASLVDIHCHIFNASDLPAANFIQVVLIENSEFFPPWLRQLDLHNPDVVRAVVNLLLFIMGEEFAPSAEEEARVLRGQQNARLTSTDSPAARGFTIERVAQFLQRAESRSPFLVQGVPTPQQGGLEVARAIRRAGGAAASGADLRTLDTQSAIAVSSRAYTSNLDIGVFIRWFELFRQYRYVHVDRLASDHATQGFSTVAIAPALVDYSKWLNEPTRSSLPDQVDVMGLIAKRNIGPLVLPYVAFDPLRMVYYGLGIDRTFDPLQLVSDAVQNKGFLGVKLYPPMGFRASGNLNDPSCYRDDVIAALPASERSRLGTRLDEALNALYDLCVKLDAPIIAHTAHSNGAGPRYSDRADPAYWLSVLKARPELRICFAHFGGFDSQSVGSTDPPPKGSWDAVIGRYLAEHPNQPVFVDVAFWDKMLDPNVDAKAVADLLKQFFVDSKVGLQHILFGTDWIMLGMSDAYPTYTTTLYDFFVKHCNLGPDAINGIFIDNARRFFPPRIAKILPVVTTAFAAGT
jgi:predicted TIM-barrel fold metal-dependent hydrolase